jgi:hypothetical protein
MASSHIFRANFCGPAPQECRSDALPSRMLQ